MKNIFFLSALIEAKKKRKKTHTAHLDLDRMSLHGKFKNKAKLRHIKIRNERIEITVHPRVKPIYKRSFVDRE